MSKRRKGKVEKSVLVSGVVICIAVAAISFSLSSGLAAQGTGDIVNVTVNAPEYVEGTFNASIGVDNITDFNSGLFDLSFDSSVVNVTDGIGLYSSSNNNTIENNTNYMATKSAKLLLVDDDHGANYETYFENALDANGYQYDVWDVYSSGRPSLNDLENYTVVIWTTGAENHDTLTHDMDQGNLEQYLDNGGKLYLSGQDVLYELWAPNTFVNNYLQITAVKNDVGYTTIQGVSGDPITDGFGTINLNYPYSNYDDEIQISSSASAIFTNPNPDTYPTVAVRYDSGTFRVVFTAFAFEAVENENATTGAQLMNKIITWLLTGNHPLHEPIRDEIRHEPIRIDGDENFTSENGVTGGSGTKDDPYIISGWDIDAHGVGNCEGFEKISKVDSDHHGDSIAAHAGNAKYIGNTSAYFIIRNCTLYDASSNGIELYNVTNGTLVNNTIYNTGNGIRLYSSSNNIIENNTIYNNGAGIRLESSSSNIIENNTIYYNTNGINFQRSGNNNNIIKNNTVYSNWNGITGTFASSTIKNNAVYNSQYGIWFGQSSNNIIEYNTIYNNYRVGLGGSKSSSNTMENNIIYNSWHGIAIGKFSSNSTIKNNTIYSNNWNGIQVSRASSITIKDNTIYSNIWNGIRFSDSSNNTIENNTIYSNNWNGIGLYSPSSNNTIENNTIYSNNWNGIGLYSPSSNNTIENNTICDNNREGIYLEESSSNTVSGNNISNNRYGISLQDSNNNSIYLNDFINNADNVCSYGSTNAWNSAEKITYTYNGLNYTNYLGNYWDDYSGSDANGDGIGDTSYGIDWRDRDKYPRTGPWEK